MGTLLLGWLLAWLTGYLVLVSLKCVCVRLGFLTLVFLSLLRQSWKLLQRICFLSHVAMTTERLTSLTSTLLVSRAAE